MKKLYKCVLPVLALFMVSVFLTNTNLNAATTSDNYAVINVMAVMEGSKAVQQMRTQLMNYKTALENEAKAKKDQLDNMQKGLLAKRGDLTEDQFNKEKLKIENTAKKMQDELINKDKKLQAVSNEAVVKIQNAIRDIVNNEAKAGKYTLIYQASALAFYEKNKDITGDIIKKLNAQLPKVKVNKPF